jgi:hypothetical protein
MNEGQRNQSKGEQDRPAATFAPCARKRRGAQRHTDDPRHAAPPGHSQKFAAQR